MGIDRSTLFPDPDGLCARINWETKNRIDRNFPPVSGERIIYAQVPRLKIKFGSDLIAGQLVLSRSDRGTPPFPMASGRTRIRIWRISKTSGVMTLPGFLNGLTRGSEYRLIIGLMVLRRLVLRGCLKSPEISTLKVRA
jgi:hypothetical protein